MSTTGQRIKERRKQLDMSADDVASQLNVSRSTIFRYENGHIKKIPANVLEKLAEILKTTLAYLMGREDDSINCDNLNIYHSGWQRDSVKDDGIIIKEAADYSYQIDERFIPIGQTVLSNDRDQIAAMAEIYLALTDSGKKKAFDYMTDLSEQSKYRKQPDSLNPQPPHKRTGPEETGDMK